jgi:hypothetical protein
VATLAEVKADLYGILVSDPTTGAPDTSLTKVKRVYLGEPRIGNMASPISVTITTAGMAPDTFNFVIRVYAIIKEDALVVQEQLDDTMWAIESLLADSSKFVKSAWSVGYVEEFDGFVASTTITSGRWP